MSTTETMCLVVIKNGARLSMQLGDQIREKYGDNTIVDFLSINFDPRNPDTEEIEAFLNLDLTGYINVYCVDRQLWEKMNLHATRLGRMPKLIEKGAFLFFVNPHRKMRWHHSYRHGGKRQD